MNEFWNIVIGGIEEKYIGEAASAYVKNAPEEKTLYRISRPQSTPKKNKGLRIFGGIAAALVITGAVAIAAVIIGNNNKISVLSPSSVPAYSEKYIPAEELYPFTKLNEGYPFNDSFYYENGNEGMNCIFRMDETGEIYEPYFRTESEKTCSIFDKISGIRNINELTKVDTPDWARAKTSEFYLLPDDRLVEIYPVDTEGYSIAYTEDDSNQYEALFYYTDANIEAIIISADENFSSLANYPNLRKLIISSDNSEFMISDKESFASLGKLEVLDISGAKVSAEIIKELPALRRVAVDCYSQPDMEYLKTVPLLKELNIYSRDDFDVTGISALSELEAVTLSVAVSASEPVPGNVEGFDELVLLPELKRLSLFSIDNDDTNVLGSLKKVEELVLNSCNINRLTFVNDMTSLKSLIVTECNLSDFALITDNYTVEELTLSFNEELYDLTQLKAFKNLKKLTIHSRMPVIYKDIAEAAVAEFRELYPDVETDIGINYQEGGLCSEDVIRALEYEEISEIPDISEIEKLLSDFKGFSYGYVSCKTVKDCISSDYIATEEMIDNGMNAGNVYEGKWYRVASGDITSQHELFLKLYEIFTSEGITCLGLDNLYCARDGELFLSENAGYDGGLLGVDEIWLSEIEKTGASTICLKLSAFGDKDTWELDEDFNDSFEVVVKNTTDGLRIHGLSSIAVDYLTWFTADCGREVTWTAF